MTGEALSSLAFYLGGQNMDSYEFWRLWLVCFAGSFIGMILANCTLGVLVWICCWATPDVRRRRRIKDGM
jgi:hypothetical protein